MKKLFFILILFYANTNFVAQNYLSKLNAHSSDPLFTTYAAPMERSEYKIDQAYHLLWYDNERGIEFTSYDGGDVCIAFRLDSTLCYTLPDYYQKPVVKTSYSDIVVIECVPFKDFVVEITFDVYSSGILIQEIKVANNSPFDNEFEVIAFLRLPADKISNLKIDKETNSFTFDLSKTRDNWMLQNKIPYEENLVNIYMSFNENAELELINDEKISPNEKLFINSEGNNYSKILPAIIHKLFFYKNSSQKFRIIRGIQSWNESQNILREKIISLQNFDLSTVILKNEKLYSNIPAIDFDFPEYEMLYYSSFSLIRQCMMPPEGEANYNYYVFSREPKWGWGYGGQVFHESLVMLAYVFMDPESAMNSQRVYMERQWENGYINYRTGPYLNESIEYDGEFTSSAPWYNYQNYEIFKITEDYKFLEEAYNSGKKFYEYYVSNRDKDNDGLCEWGAHAVLECVRDARVAVWDRVGWPSYFEAVDLNSMLIMEENSLAKMAELLGLNGEKEKWLKTAQDRMVLLNKTFFDEAEGFYFHVDKETHEFTHKNENDLKIKEIIGFLPMWANAADSEKVSELIKHFNNPHEFYRKFGVPTLSADDHYYNPIGYWNGPIWVQWQYLIFRGLIDYGYKDDATDLAYRVIENIVNQLKIDHNFWEFYSADDYQAGWNKSYIWTGIAARMLIDIHHLKGTQKSDK